MAWVVEATVVKLAQEACLAGRALAVEVARSIVTRGPILASGRGTIVDVVCAILALPTVHTDALVAAARLVDASGAILANAWPYGAVVRRCVLLVVSVMVVVVVVVVILV